MSKSFTRELRFMLPLNETTGEILEKPVVKLTTAGAERPPPAPWVKISEGSPSVEPERRHDISESFEGLGMVKKCEVDEDLACDES